MKLWRKVSIISLLISVCVMLIVGFEYMHSLDYRRVGVPVLNYHQVNSQFDSALTMHPIEFERQLKYLKEEGYQSITLDELYNYIQGGMELPEKPVLITFDDGYIDNYEVAFPLLQKYQMKATLFMIANSIGAPRFVNQDQLLEMERGGFHIESHTNSHRRLDLLSEQEVMEEFTVSKKILEESMKYSISYMAYPQGFPPKDIDFIGKQTGYKLGFTVAPGNAKPGMNLYTLPREAIFNNDYPFISFWMRLHFPDEVAALWNFRDWLLHEGFDRVAQFVPLF